MKVFLMLSVLLTLLWSDRKDEIKALYDEVIEKTREDLNPEINRLKNPFIKPQPPLRQTAFPNTLKDNNLTDHPNIPVVFTLHAIINDSAKINSQWYKRGETLSGYRITKLTPYTVKLSNTVDDGREQTRVLHLIQPGKIQISHTLPTSDKKVKSQ